MSETVNWLNLADKFAADGDPQGMRACARELWESDARSKLEGAAVMAEAALYGGDLDEAASLADGVLQSEPQHLRARLVSAGVAAREFRLDAALPGLHDVVEEAMRKLKALDSSDAYYATLQNVVRKAQGWMADMLYLAGRPEQAAEALRTCARFAVTPEQLAIFTSKALFMDNYRELAPAESRQRAEDWAAICPVKPYQHAAARKIPDKRLRIGYLSPDW
ncbi:MAG: hypothetical protein II093_07890, partial [Selenomonas sp.]|nr:hypothetical protein [Selenomonas sp.]